MTPRSESQKVKAEEFWRNYPERIVLVEGQILTPNPAQIEGLLLLLMYSVGLSTVINILPRESLGDLRILLAGLEKDEVQETQLTKPVEKKVIYTCYAQYLLSEMGFL